MSHKEALKQLKEYAKSGHTNYETYLALDDEWRIRKIQPSLEEQERRLASAGVMQ